MAHRNHHYCIIDWYINMVTIVAQKSHSLYDYTWCILSTWWWMVVFCSVSDVVAKSYCEENYKKCMDTCRWCAILYISCCVCTPVTNLCRVLWSCSQVRFVPLVPVVLYQMLSHSFQVIGVLLIQTLNPAESNQQRTIYIDAIIQVLLCQNSCAHMQLTLLCVHLPTKKWHMHKIIFIKIIAI